MWAAVEKQVSKLANLSLNFNGEIKCQENETIYFKAYVLHEATNTNKYIIYHLGHKEFNLKEMVYKHMWIALPFQESIKAFEVFIRKFLDSKVPTLLLDLYKDILLMHWKAVKCKS